MLTRRAPRRRLFRERAHSAHQASVFAFDVVKMWHGSRDTQRLLGLRNKCRRAMAGRDRSSTSRPKRRVTNDAQALIRVVAPRRNERLERSARYSGGREETTRHERAERGWREEAKFVGHAHQPPVAQNARAAVFVAHRLQLEPEARGRVRSAAGFSVASESAPISRMKSSLWRVSMHPPTRLLRSMSVTFANSLAK